ncbi:MAG: TVP38/TMEM64 family protein [Rhodospirillales bacterium]|nr:TVP38/TMEM64 family protein [Rhodospirillales bacterium]
MSDREEAEPKGSENGRAPFPWKRLVLLLVVLFGGLVVFRAFELHRFVNCGTLAEHRQFLLDYVAMQQLLATLIFMAVYAAATAFSLPVGALLSIASGFLFGTALATGMVVIAATLGATVVFLIAKTLLGDTLRARAGPRLDKMAKGFEDNAFSYLLVLRLVPLFPFWLVNVAPAFLGVPLGTFFLATLVGIVPGTFVFVSVGAGLGSILEDGGHCSLTGVFTPQVIVALVGLAVLALIPVVYKKLKARRG